MSAPSQLRRSSRLSAKNSPKNPPKKPKPSRTPRAKKGDSQPPSRPKRGRGTGMLYLRVHRARLYRLPAVTADQPNPDPLEPLLGTTGHLNVIIASPADLHPFTGNTVDWLIKVARFIFEPLGTGSLLTFTMNTLEWWLNRDRDLTWRPVVPEEQLMATIYEFCPTNALIELSKMSLRQMTSVTTETSRPQATAFRNAVNARDGACIISTYSGPTIASHLVPKRLGDAGVQSVVQRFTVSHPPVNRYHPTIGVRLLQALDSRVNNYELGFWNYGPDQYVIHNFYDEPLNILGLEPRIPTQTVPILHDYQITLTSHDGSPLPSVGTFNWHYLQCVLKRFAANEYKQIENIIYFTVPFCTEDDDDEGGFGFDDERNIANPLYPSYPIELAEARVRQHLEDAERDCAIVEWNSRVSIS